MKNKSKLITLTLTHACNLACVYCYEVNRTSGNMSIETAKKILDCEFSKIGEGETLQVDLFGGEPFLRFELIKEVISYVRDEFPTKNAVFFIITNGTILDEKVKKWLIENRDCVICGLSFDGNREMQNVNRSNSFDMVDLNFFIENYPTQTIKMTVSDQTLNTLASGVIFLQSKGFDVACNLAYGIDWHNQNYCQILERELMKLIEYYLANPKVSVCSMLSMDITQVAFRRSSKLRYCGAGINMVAYDVDGQSYPCQMFMPLSAGKEKAYLSHEITFLKDSIPDDLLDKKCRDCVIKALCPNCYGANYISTGNIYVRDDTNCNLMKIIMKARSYLQGMMWQQGRLNLSKREEALLLRSIEILQRDLSY